MKVHRGFESRAESFYLENSGDSRHSGLSVGLS